MSKTLAITISLLLSAPLGAIPEPPFDLVTLVSQADLIVVGKVLFVADNGPASPDAAGRRNDGRYAAGDIQVDEVLKGPQLRQVRFRYLLPEQARGYGRVAQQRRRMFFLKRNGEVYEFVSDYYPSAVAVGGKRHQTDEALDRVIEELGYVIESGVTASVQKLEAIHSLRGITTSSAIAALRLGVQATDKVVQLEAVAVLLAAGDTTAVSLAEAALMQSDGTVSPNVLLNLRGGLGAGSKSTESIPSLERLLQSKEPETRRAAVMALRSTHSRLAIRALVRALEDAEPTIQGQAVSALAEITDQSQWGPSREAFLADPHRYLAYWNDWAKRNVR